MKRLAILGSTGSVGEQTLSVVEEFPDRYRAVALAAGRNIDKLADQIRRHHPDLVAVAEPAGADLLRHKLGNRAGDVRIEVGERGLEAVAVHDAEGFGNCTNHGACEVACPKGISVKYIARLNRDLIVASLRSAPGD